MRASTFATVGVDVSSCSTISEVLHKANLDYRVNKVPIYFQDKLSYATYNGKMLTQKENTSEIFGVVSSKYKVCQNSVAFAFMDYLKQEMGLNFVRAGETDKGLVYVIGKLDPVDVLGDAITPYIVFQNSHNGLSSMRATISPLRVVCQNQFNLSIEGISNTSRIVHSANMDRRILVAQQMIQNSDKYMQQFSELAETLANKKVSHDFVIQIFNTYIVGTKNSQVSLSDFMECYTCDDNHNFIGTCWGILNSVADYLTHSKSNKLITDDNKFVSTTLTSDTMNKICTRLLD